MTTQYIARAYDGVRWISHLPTDHIDTARAQARGLMDLFATTPQPPHRDVTPWLLIEVASTDATGAIVNQWIGTSEGYRSVVGRNDGYTYETLPQCMLR